MISAPTYATNNLANFPGNSSKQPNESLQRNERSQDVRYQNIAAAKALADVIRTSLGPRGMDKMIYDNKGTVIITNDGATILKEMSVVHPASKIFVEMSKAQDSEVGDGTTSVVIIAGALLDEAKRLLMRSVHFQSIAQSFLQASEKAIQILDDIAIPINIDNRDDLLKAAITALSSKAVSFDSHLLAPIAVTSVMKIAEASSSDNIDLNDIRIVKKLGGTVEDTELIDGLVFTNEKVSRVSGAPTKVENAKIALIQFCLSPPKTDMENNITIKDYQAMDRLLREEKIHTARLIQKIKSTGCNVLLIQKSILREAVTDLALDFAAKNGILLIRDIEREDVEFISKTLCCVPISSPDYLKSEYLGKADLVRDEVTSYGRITKITGVPGKSTVTIFCRASNNLILDETERSIYDALCVVRSLIKKKALLPGGGASEIEISYRLSQWAQTLPGHLSLCVKAYAEAFNIIPYTLAENSGLKPIEVVTELINKHAENLSNTGINVKTGKIVDMVEEKVVQPCLYSESIIKLATETVVSILKIDDIFLTR